MGVWKTLDDQLIPALDQFEKWGVKGIKVDFMQRSDQIMIDYFYKRCREAAKRHMLVDFHGDQKPAVMTRTWPNLISTEGVRGMEWSKWSAESEPQHNVTPAVHAHVPGPDGLHAGRDAQCHPHDLRADQSASRWRWARAVSSWRCMSSTRAPLQMLSDSPSNYLREPESNGVSLSAFRRCGTRRKCWTQRLREYVVVARRSGRTGTSGQ